MLERRICNEWKKHTPNWRFSLLNRGKTHFLENVKRFGLELEEKGAWFFVFLLFKTQSNLACLYECYFIATHTNHRFLLDTSKWATVPPSNFLPRLRDWGTHWSWCRRSRGSPRSWLPWPRPVSSSWSLCSVRKSGRRCRTRQNGTGRNAPCNKKFLFAGLEFTRRNLRGLRLGTW